jgi:hypothetical protein
MKRLWARVGMSFELSDEEYEEFITNCRGDNTQRLKAENTLINWIESGIAEFDGETYFPEQGCFGDDDTDNVEELSFLL